MMAVLLNENATFTHFIEQSLPMTSAVRADAVHPAVRADAIPRMAMKFNNTHTLLDFPLTRPSTWSRRFCKKRWNNENITF